MKTLNIILIFVAIIFATNTIEAQVKFKLSYDTEDELYTVSIIPNETFESPDNITGTGQVTIRVPSNYFEPANVTNLHDQMVWHANSRTDSPIEAADFDYVSFGLMNPGVSNPDYKAGEEIQLFSFENAYGCTGGIEIVDNYKDPFMAPNSKSVNIGNSLTIFGAGGEAWAGLVGDGKVNCMTTSTTDLAEITEFSVFPNPVSDFVNVEVYWEQESTDATLKIVDASGKTLKRDYIELKNGANTFRYEASNFSSGVYWIEIEGNDWKLNLDRFFKGN
ncbi:T9SS type A sorting domain-containing protein [Saprospiraceae bacterium]|nr:T9SS type A sorting domain-containing protein [Bacteroidota bacterium]MDB4727304.1 T9SS type A sorting domain-containing protein [Saprospiraceae bacterium]